jgi:hypothetical protein
MGSVCAFSQAAEFCLLIMLLLGDKLARGLMEAAPMAHELFTEFEMMDKAVTERDANVHAEWESEFAAWVGGDHSGRCPFQTLESKTRMYGFSL